MSLRTLLANLLLQQPSYRLKPNAFFDFSHWETVNDWRKVVFPAGTVGLITKATDGKDWLDPTFVPYFQAFGEVFPQYFRGAYHFFQPHDIAGQVINFVTHVTDAGWKDGDIAILDVEYIPPAWRKGEVNIVRGAQYAYQVKVLLDGIEKELGVRPIVYWSKNVVNQMLDGLGRPPAWMNEYWNWVAWYPLSEYVDANEWLPSVAYPKGLLPEKVAGWQYATNWVIQGINFDGVDVNTASAAWLASLKKPLPPPPPPDVPPVPFKPYISAVEITRVINEKGDIKIERLEA